MDWLPLQWKLSFKFMPRKTNVESTSSIIYFKSENMPAGQDAKVIEVMIATNKMLYIKLVSSVSAPGWYNSKNPIDMTTWTYVRIK